jgi:hypothetical protein
MKVEQRTNQLPSLLVTQEERELNQVHHGLRTVAFPPSLFFVVLPDLARRSAPRKGDGSAATPLLSWLERRAMVMTSWITRMMRWREKTSWIAKLRL